MMRAQTEAVLLLLALALVAAFITSFALGVIRGRDGGTAPPVVTANPPPAVSDSAPAAPAARVEVLNASGTSGLARGATETLRAAGFDVVFFGNAPASASPDTTVVLDRTGDREPARAVARALGAVRIETAIDSTLLLDVTVMLGRDWRMRRDSTER
jgi:hypothetical protein